MSGKYYGSLYDKASEFLKWRNRNTFSSEEIQALVSSNLPLVYTQILDLTVARPKSNPFVIEQTGRAVVLYGITNSTAYNPVANTGLEAVQNGVFVGCWFNASMEDTSMVGLKHARGFRGDFKKLFMTWPAQADKYGRLCIFKFDANPFPSGDFPT